MKIEIEKTYLIHLDDGETIRVTKSEALDLYNELKILLFGESSTAAEDEDDIVDKNEDNKCDADTIVEGVLDLLKKRKFDNPIPNIWGFPEKIPYFDHPTIIPYVPKWDPMPWQYPGTIKPSITCSSSEFFKKDIE